MKIYLALKDDLYDIKHAKPEPGTTYAAHVDDDGDLILIPLDGPESDAYLTKKIVGRLQREVEELG